MFSKAGLAIGISIAASLEVAVIASSLAAIV